MARTAFSITSELVPAKGVVRLGVNGYLDSHTCDELDTAITGQFKEARHKIIVDLSNVVYISSAGAGVFISALLEAQEHNGNIVLLSPTPHVREVFELLGITQIFKVVDDLPAALDAF